MTTSSTAGLPVVVGIDGSPASDLALEWGARQAALEDRPLTLVHASATERTGSAMERAETRALDEHRVWEVRQVVTETDPRVELLELAERAAMIVIGSRGRGAVSSLLLGSVSSAVTTHAACPVVVIRPDDPGTSRVLPLRGILVGFCKDFVEDVTLEMAFRLASSRGLRLTVLQCTRSPDADDPHQGNTAEVVEMSSRYPNVRVSVLFEDGSLDHWLIELSSTMDAVVLGSHRPSLLRRAAHGSLVLRVLERACGVVVVVPLPGHA